MKFRTTLKPVGVAIAAVIVAAVSTAAASAAPAGKKFTWSTTSPVALEATAQVIRATETFQFGPPVFAIAKKAVDADPNYAFGYYLCATFAASPAEAKPFQEKAVELAKNASDGERRYMEAVFLVRSQQADKALPILQDLHKTYPDERLVMMMLGQVSLNTGDVATAKMLFEKAVKADDTTPRAMSFLGNVQLLQGDYAGARKQYQKALKASTANIAPFGPYTGLAYSYIYEAKYDDAISTLKEFKDNYVKAGNNANFPEVFIWNAIARVYLESGRPAEAIPFYEGGYKSVEASSLDPVEKQIWYGRVHHGKGRSLAKLGKAQEAWAEAELIKKMIDEGGERGKEFIGSYHYIAGYLKLEAGDYAAAIEHIKQSDLTDPFHMLILARAYEKAGDKENAIKSYEAITQSRIVNMERALSFPEASRRLKALKAA